jgi:hypothetical protein
MHTFPDMYASSWTAYVIVCTIVVLLYSSNSSRKTAHREPPRVRATIPLFGHIFGLLRFGVPYYEKIACVNLSLSCCASMLSKCYSHRVSDPIFSIDVLVNRVYIVKSARLVAAVQKNHKCISFDPFLTAAANRMAGIRGPGLKLLQERRSGGHDLNNKVLHAMTHSLLGKGLDCMNSTMLSKMEPLIDELVNTTNISLDLHGWCRHVITTASTEAIWGSQNPFRSEKTVQNFW